MKEQRKDFQDKNPGVEFGKLSKIMGAYWKNDMTKEDKQKYVDLAEQDKKRYEDEVEKKRTIIRRHHRRLRNRKRRRRGKEIRMNLSSLLMLIYSGRKKIGKSWLRRTLKQKERRLINFVERSGRL